MSQRTAFALAGGLTVFFIVIVAAVAFSLSGSQQQATGAQAQSAVAGDQAAAVSTDPMSDPTLRALIGEREAAYKSALEEANSRLQQANAKMQQMSDQIKTLSAQVQAQGPAATAAVQPAATAMPQPPQDQQTAQGPALSANQAALIATYSVPGVSVQAEPTLVNFQGAIAYQVQTTGGPVYIDANNGQVLYSGVAAAPAPRSGEREGDDDH